MQCTIKWWREGPKAVGIEYRSLVSSSEIEAAIFELRDKAHARLIEIHNDAGDLLASYPDSKRHRPRFR